MNFLTTATRTTAWIDFNRNPMERNRGIIIKRKGHGSFALIKHGCSVYSLSAFLLLILFLSSSCAIELPGNKNSISINRSDVQSSSSPPPSAAAASSPPTSSSSPTLSLSLPPCALSLWPHLEGHQQSFGRKEGRHERRNEVGHVRRFKSRRELLKRKNRRYVDPEFEFVDPKPADLQIECIPLRSKRFFTDGFCTSVGPVDDHVCTGKCLPIGDLPWYAEYIKVWSRTKTHDYRCVDDVVVRKKIPFVCHNGQNRTYTIPVVQSCKCKRHDRNQNRTPTKSSKHRKSQKTKIKKKYDKLRILHENELSTTTTNTQTTPTTTTTTTTTTTSMTTTQEPFQDGTDHLVEFSDDGNSSLMSDYRHLKNNEM